ncbi:MAG TPA: response regulator [Polyangia bacterium]|jgi:CheY-like chemotaxis protein
MSAPSATPGPALVLVVDDEDDIREVLRLALEAEGYRVETAAHGREALARLAAGARPCLILLDLMMPVMDGFEFLAARARDPVAAAIPVLVVSAFADRAAAVTGVAGILKKPVDLDVLLAQVARHCRASASGA